jgi:hypothetical protein
MDQRSTSSVLTHTVSRLFAGIGVFGFLHNESVAFFKDQSATTAIKVSTGLGFGLASTASGWNFGGGRLVYDLVALAVGRKGDWRALLSLYGCWSCWHYNGEEYSSVGKPLQRAGSCYDV